MQTHQNKVTVQQNSRKLAWFQGMFFPLFHSGENPGTCLALLQHLQSLKHKRVQKAMYK